MSTIKKKKIGKWYNWIPYYLIMYQIMKEKSNWVAIQNKWANIASSIQVVPSMILIYNFFVKLKHEKASHLFWRNSCLYSVGSKQVGDFFKFLWPFQKSWTLPVNFPPHLSQLSLTLVPAWWAAILWCRKEVSFSKGFRHTPQKKVRLRWWWA